MIGRVTHCSLHTGRKKGVALLPLISGGRQNGKAFGICLRMIQQPTAFIENDPSPRPALCSRRLGILSPFAVTRLGMRIMLDAMDLECVFSEYVSPSQYVKEHQGDDVLLLDLAVPRLDFKEVKKVLRHRSRAGRTLALLDSAFLFPYLEEVYREGIGGMIESDAQKGEWIEAVQTLLNGGRYYCRRIRAERFDERLPPVASCSHHPLSHLSDRQVQVFQWIGCGCSTREIANRLNLSPKTVETHRDHLKEKLGLDGADALIRAARRWVRNGSLAA